MCGYTSMQDSANLTSTTISSLEEKEFFGFVREERKQLNPVSIMAKKLTELTKKSVPFENNPLKPATLLQSNTTGNFLNIYAGDQFFTSSV